MLDKLKYRLSQRAKEQELRRTGGTPEAAPFHRTAYHRNFEGYTEVKTINERGKVVIKRIYTGKYYEPALAPFRRLTLRLLYALFFIGGTGLFFFTATRPCACNSTPYVNVFQAFAIPMLLWCLYILAFYIPARGRLTAGDYHTLHKPLIRSSMLSALCMWSTAAAATVNFALHFSSYTTRELLCVPGFALAGLPLFLITVLETNLNYTVTNSGEQAPPEGVEIES